VSYEPFAQKKAKKAYKMNLCGFGASGCSAKWLSGVGWLPWARVGWKLGLVPAKAPELK